MSPRALIVNADDYGRSAAINAGVLEAHRNGVVTSASLMVRWPAAQAAAVAARSHPLLSVGLHFDLGEWIFRAGCWEQQHIVLDDTGPEAMAAEAAAQLDAFRSLMGRDPTHLDSHQHVHLDDPARSILVGLGQELKVPVRQLSPQVRFCGDFYGQTAEGDPLAEAITVQALLGLLTELPMGVTELACHPGYGAGCESGYDFERRQELASLCDPRVKECLQTAGIRLRSFAPPL